jgi:hypothetical protein
MKRIRASFLLEAMNMTSTQDISYMEPALQHLHDHPRPEPTREEISRLAHELCQRDLTPTKSPEE